MKVYEEEGVMAVRIAAGDERAPKIAYYLIEERKEGRASYAIRCVCEDDGRLWEKEAVVRDVTSLKEEGLRLLELLCRCRVTPYGLKEAVTEGIS